MTRVTSTSSLVPNVVKRTSASGTIRYYTNSVTTLVPSTLTRSDITRNPRDAEGWRQPTAYSASVVNKDQVRVIARLGYGSEVWDLDIPMSYPKTSTPLPTTADINIAVIKARNAVADRVSSFGESLAELSQSVSGLAKLASQVDSFIASALRKDYKGVARHLGINPKSRKHRRATVRFSKLAPNVGNAFLCWNFGLSPIIGDMVALAILMGAGKPLRVTGVGLHGRQNGNPVLTSTGVQSFPYVSGSGCETVCQNRTFVGTKVHLDYTVSIEALRQLTSYGLMDAPATVWALAPYSFLLDFVLPVSEVLRSLTATFGLAFKGGSATRFSRCVSKYMYTKLHPLAGASTLDWRPDGSDRVELNMVRTVFKSDPNPVTLWLKDPFDAFEAATVFSLLAQRLAPSLKPTK